MLSITRYFHCSSAPTNLGHCPPARWQSLGCQTKGTSEERCFELREKHSAKRLDELRRTILKRFTGRQNQTFNRAEQNWEEFKRATCAFEASDPRAAGSSATVAVCGHVYNVSRIRLLSKYDYCLNRGACSSDFALYLIVSWQEHS